MPRTLPALVLAALLSTTAAQEPAVYEHAPVALPPAMKAALAKKVTLKDMEGTPIRLVTQLAADHKLKVAFSDALTKEKDLLLRGQGKVVGQKGVRLDIVLHQFLSDAGIPPVCVVKDDTLVFTTESDPDAVVKKKPAQPGAVVVAAVRQPPDGSHSLIVSVIRKKMTEKADYDARNAIPLVDALAAVTKQTGIPYPVNVPSFEAAGVPMVRDKLVTIKGGKMLTHDAVLREVLAPVDGAFYVDPYGSPQVVHKDDRRVRAKK